MFLVAQFTLTQFTIAFGLPPVEPEQSRLRIVFTLQQIEEDLVRTQFLLVEAVSHAL